jgi:hypothetical protein
MPSSSGSSDIVSNLKLSVDFALPPCFFCILQKNDFVKVTYFLKKPSWRSRYSCWLRAGWWRGRNSSPSRVKNFLFSKSSRPALGSTQSPMQWVPGALSPRVKRPGREADHSPQARGEVKNVDLYIHSPIRLHGVVLNSLSTGTTLPYLYLHIF